MQSISEKNASAGKLECLIAAAAFAAMLALLFSPRVNWSLPLIELPYNHQAPIVVDITLPTALPITAGVDPQPLLVSKGDIAQTTEQPQLIGQTGTAMVVRGWIAFAGGTRPEALIAQIDGIEAGSTNIFFARTETSFRFKRPDVALAGWELRMRSNVPAGVHQLTLAAVVQGKTVPVAGRALLVVN